MSPQVYYSTGYEPTPPGADPKQKFSKLNNDYYDLWVQRAKSKLIIENLWKYVNKAQSRQAL